MNYAVIENTGEVDIRSFYVMGMGTKSEDDESIGQFGTGNKYGITALLRNNNNVVITSGTRKITARTEEEAFRDKTFESVFFLEDDEKIPTGMTLDMGKHNWDVTRALREFVSNAIDEGGFKYFYSDTIQPEENKTRIYITRSSDVNGFFDDIGKHFILDRVPLLETNFGNFYESTCPGGRVYRKGVLVHETDSNALWDYDTSEIDINEDRRSSSSDVRWGIKKMIGAIPLKMKTEMINHISEHYEDAMEYDVELGYAPLDEEWIAAVGGRIIITNNQYQMHADRLMSFDVCVIPRNWVYFLKKIDGMKTVKDCLSEQTLSGWETTADEPYHKKIIERTIQFLNGFNYKIKEEDIVVAKNMQNSAHLGQYCNGKYYVNESSFRKGYDEVLDTVAHEMFHAMSREHDATIGFERFLVAELLYQLKRLKAYRDEEDEQRSELNKIMELQREGINDKVS